MFPTSGPIVLITMRKPKIYSVREKNALVPTSEPAPSDEESKPSPSTKQLLEQFSQVIQNPPPGAGGIFGTGEPWDMAPPVETPEGYHSRVRRGPTHDSKTVQEASADIYEADRRGDATFSILRKGDLRDATQHAADHGDLRTWLILGGSCALFLLLMLLLILLPHGNDTHPPHIWVY